MRVILQPAAGNPHGERQLATVAHNPQRGLALELDPRRADDLAEQLHRDIEIEDFDFVRARARQPAERAAAGHDHGARRRARQQRPDLSEVPGIVEHDQRLPALQPRAVERGALIV